MYSSCGSPKYMISSTRLRDVRDGAPLIGSGFVLIVHRPGTGTAWWTFGSTFNVLFSMQNTSSMLQARKVGTDCSFMIHAAARVSCSELSTMTIILLTATLVALPSASPMMPESRGRRLSERRCSVIPVAAAWMAAAQGFASRQEHTRVVQGLMLPRGWVKSHLLKCTWARMWIKVQPACPSNAAASSDCVDSHQMHWLF
mmetsp:Transcript_9806/g.29011  ORF Transcript_9806/g.29011 Transcript_9806/m.29011 type:complete len:200 (+) Transcript_9806:157-756(+)